MLTINYPLHLRMLVRAAILFGLINWLTNLMVGDAVVWIFYGGMGALHAIAILLSLHKSIKVRPVKAAFFAATVALVSLAAFFSFFVPGAALNNLRRFRVFGSDDFRFLLILAFASAFGAAVYWLLLRFFWMQDRKWSGVAVAVAFCVPATLISFPLADVLLQQWAKDYGLLVPTFAWWAAFSLSLYVCDRLALREIIPVSAAT